MIETKLDRTDVVAANSFSAYNMFVNCVQNSIICKALSNLSTTNFYLLQAHCFRYLLGIVLPSVWFNSFAVERECN